MASDKDRGEKAAAAAEPGNAPMPNPGDVARPGTPGTGEAVCPTCQGTGLKDRRPCPDCGGSGVVIAGVAGG